MLKKRNTFNYNLKNGKEIVYKGITNDLEKRANEHADEGKKFTHIQKVGRVKTEIGAIKTEKNELETYRKSHSGKNPRYNKTDDG